MSSRALGIAASLCTFACVGGGGPPPPVALQAPAATPAAPPSAVPSASLHPRLTRSLPRGALWIAQDDGEVPRLWLVRGDTAAPLACDPLPGAWALEVDDVDGDGRLEAIVALRKPARFDPGDHARLHVYAFEGGQCVPLWRGTRLAGRFDGLALDPERRGAIVVHEWLAPERRRIARYVWADFGYRVDAVLWEGRGAPPVSLASPLRWAHGGPTAADPDEAP